MTHAGDAFFEHSDRTEFASLPSDVVDQANRLIAGTLGSALAGSVHTRASAFRDLQRAHYGFGGVPVWGTDQLLGWIGAGMANGFQSHCSGPANVHDGTAIEPLSVIVPAVLAYADRFGQVSGENVVAAVTVGTDVAATLALGETDPRHSSRSSLYGAIGAGAALAKLEGLDRPATMELFGLIEAQVPVPSTSETEDQFGASLRMAFAVRAALTAFDLNRQYLTGPTVAFANIAGASLPLADLGKIWRVSEFSVLPVDQHRKKFTESAMTAAQPLGKDTAERLYERLLSLQDEVDVSVLSALASGVDLEKEIV